jgi:hypothetical protein
MTNNQAEKDLKAVEKILTQPVFIGFSEETIRVRRNLLTIAFFVVVYKLSELEIDIFSFLGTTFKNGKPSKEFLDITLLCLIIYHFAHFIWQSIDAWKECKLRVTGTNALFMKNDIAKESSEDYAFDPLQSSLLNWLWKRTKFTEDDYYEPTEDVLNAMTDEKFDLKDKGTALPPLKPNLESDALLNINNIHKAINADRNLVSLNRFEEFYEGFAWSQILRWCILEFGVPAVLALFAMYQTFPFPCWITS